jgi:trans-2,3-dihydro-3-hydroxyanthranilate isomerase
MQMNSLRLETGVGTIDVELERQGDRLHLAHMTQPLPKFSPYERETELRAALGLCSDEGLLPAMVAENGPVHVLVEAKSQRQLDALRPDYGAVARITTTGALVFSQDGEHCHARYFAPAAGINEDPATGSAAGPLGAHLVLFDRHPSGERLVVLQGHEMGRPSTLLVSAEAEGKKMVRVRVGGSAVVIGRGEMHLP